MEYDLLADHMLVRLLRADDEIAFRQIYLKYWRALYLGVLKKVRVSHIAEELVQNVFVSLWEKRQNLNIRELAPYLQTAVKYQAINYIKSSILHKRVTDSMVIDFPLNKNSSASTLLTHELTQAIDRAIRHLPEKTQQVFRLSHMENQSNSEISKSLQISEKAVEYHITRSLRILRFELKDFMYLLIGALSLFYS
ncbi:MAG TPA: RNA polymerase sigma-70 factor [Puia sp.]